MHEKDEAGEEVDGADDGLPDTAACGVGFEGEGEVGDAAKDHGPAEDEGDRDAGDGWDADGEESGDDEEDAEGDGPVDCFGNEAGEGGWGGAHGGSSVSRRYWAGGRAQNIIKAGCAE